MFNKINLSKLGIKTFKRGKFIYLKGSHHRVREKIPLDGKLALFLGLLFGDGWVVDRENANKHYDWTLGIVEDDKFLIKHLTVLIKDIFNIDPVIFYRKRITKYYEIRINNKIIYEFITKNFDFSTSFKKDKLHIPKQILEDNYLSRMFLQGLFSTDGALVFSADYPRISLSSASHDFIVEVNTLLKKLGFDPHINKYNRKNGNLLYNVRLNGMLQANLFYDKINFVGEKTSRLKNLILYNKMQPLRLAGQGPRALDPCTSVRIR